MNKRLTALFLAFAIIIAMLPAAVLTASAETYSGYYGNDIRWTLNTKTGTLKITGTGDMPNFNRRYIPWSDYRDKIQTAEIAENVTSIGSYAFDECTALKSITIPDSVTSIGYAAFLSCSALTSITIGKNITSIEAWAFFEAGLVDVYYEGTKTEWKAISIGSDNQCLTGANIHYLDEPVTPPADFSDVPKNAWFYDAVSFAVANGLMNGTGNNKFEPDTPVTRAMIVTVLWRYDGSPKEGTNAFSDVRNGEWYTDAIAWASKNGVVNGYGGGKFGPNDNLTREQMASIILRYTNLKGKKTNTLKDLGGFADAAKVSQWANISVRWAVGFGLINGKSSGGKTLLDPQGKATRAEIATILMRYIQRQDELKPLNDPKSCSHNWLINSQGTATCTAAGTATYYCTECAGTKTDTTPALGHNYAMTVVTATCTTGGYDKYTCTRCGKTYQDNQTAALGHNYTKTVVTATCSTGGYEEYTCQRCWYSYKQNQTPATGKHKLNTRGVCTECKKCVGVLMFSLEGIMRVIPQNEVAEYEKVGWYTIDSFVAAIKAKRVSVTACNKAILCIDNATDGLYPTYQPTCFEDKSKIEKAWMQYLNGGCPIAIMSSTIGYYGPPMAEIVVRNLSGKRIIEFDIVFDCYDAYGSPAKDYTGSNHVITYFSYAYAYSIVNDGTMFLCDLTGYERCRQIKNIYITKIAFDDGSCWYR